MTLNILVGVCALALWCVPGAAAAFAAVAQAAPIRPASGAVPQRALSAGTADADAYNQFMVGRYLESEGDVQGAIKAYTEASRLDPKSAELRAELASLYARDNQFEEAMKNAQLALGNDRDNVTAHRVLGILYASLARADEGSGPLGAEAAGHAARAVEHLEAARTHAGAADAGLDMMLAQIYLRIGEYDKAAAVLSRVANDEPDRPEPVTLLVQAYQRAGKTDEAVKALERTVASQPRFYPMLGELYERRQRWADAASAYERAVARNPKSLDLRTKLAAALLSGGGEPEAGRAIEVLQQLRQESPGDGRVLYLLAQGQRTVGRLDDAETTARELTKVAPGSLTGPYSLALALEAKQQYRQVVEILAPATAQPPSPGAGLEMTPLLVHLGFAHLEIGEYDQALTAFERARATSPGNRVVDLYILQVQVAARRFDQALALARSLRSARPSDQRVIRLEADALRQTGKPDEGAALLTRAVDENPNDLAAYLALAEYRAQTGQFDAAMQVVDRAAAKFPSELSVTFEAGAVLERQKRFADAERKFKEVLARDPLHAQALNYLGYMLADRGERLDEAIGYIRRALEVEPHNGAYLDSLGWAYFRQNRLDQAESYLRRAADQRVRGSAVQEHFGDVLFRLGRYDEAVGAWLRALEGDGEQVDAAVIDKKIRSAREKAPKR
jgi:tetratricopeptide (TPR) repeat protein